MNDTGMLRFEGADGELIIAHSAHARGLARVVSRRAARMEADEPDANSVQLPLLSGDRPGTAPRGARFAFVGAAIDQGEGILHGVNECGLLVAAGGAGGAREDAAALIARGLLEASANFDDAITSAAQRIRDLASPPLALWVAQGRSTASLMVEHGDLRVVTDDDAESLQHPAQLGDAFQSVRRHAPAWPADDDGSQCRHHPDRRTVSVLVARFVTDGAAATFLCSGPPCCGVFVRYWPGIEVGPDAAAGSSGPARAALLTAELGALVAAEPTRLPVVEERLGGIEIETMAEGEAAERLALMMDHDGDDRGAEVRRAVAQAHALELATAAIGELVAAGERPAPNL